MTHIRQPGTDVFKSFLSVIQPLIEAGKMGCILAQFPYSFKCDKNNLDYLDRFRNY